MQCKRLFPSCVGQWLRSIKCVIFSLGPSFHFIASHFLQLNCNLPCAGSMFLLKFNSTALLSILIVDISVTWSNICNYFSSNFVSTSLWYFYFSSYYVAWIWWQNQWQWLAWFVCLTGRVREIMLYRLKQHHKIRISFSMTVCLFNLTVHSDCLYISCSALLPLVLTVLN